jgi:hypothetical protein
MRIRLLFSICLAAGFLVGARSGRARYDAVSRGLRDLGDRAEVQETAAVLQVQASQLANGAVVRVRGLGGHLRHVFDGASEPVLESQHPA